jgi:hypothetical protein
VLDTTSGVITFTPAPGFTGTAHSVRYRVTDAYGQSSHAAFTAIVAAASTAPTTPSATPVAAPAAGPATTTAAPPTASPAPAVCVSRRSVAIHFRIPNGATLRSLRVSLDGNAARSLSVTARSVAVSMRGYAATSVRVKLQATTTAGRTLTAERVYRTCAPRPSTATPATLYLRSV